MTTRSTARRGRPTLLTPVVIEKLGQAVEAGMTRSQAAEVAGINAGSFARWMTRGRAAQNLFDSGISVEETEQPYGDLYRRIVKADSTRRVAENPSTEPEPARESEAEPDLAKSEAVTTRSIPLTFRWRLVRVDEHDLGASPHWYRNFGVARPHRFSIGGWRNGRVVPVSTGWMCSGPPGGPMKINGVSATFASRTVYFVRLFTRAEQRGHYLYRPLLRRLRGKR